MDLAGTTALAARYLEREVRQASLHPPHSEASSGVRSCEVASSA
jgi:hypothetical protein